MLVIHQLTGNGHDGGTETIGKRKNGSANGRLILVPNRLDNLNEKVRKSEINGNRQPVRRREYRRSIVSSASLKTSMAE